MTQPELNEISPVDIVGCPGSSDFSAPLLLLYRHVTLQLELELGLDIALVWRVSVSCGERTYIGDCQYNYTLGLVES